VPIAVGVLKAVDQRRLGAHCHPELGAIEVALVGVGVAAVVVVVVVFALLAGALWPPKSARRLPRSALVRESSWLSLAGRMGVELSAALCS